MKTFAVLALLLAARLAAAQGALPWGQALSVPALAAAPNVALYYVASYSGVGTHTNYDMAMRAAGAFLAANPKTPTYLVLGPELYETCDDAALPAVSMGGGKTATVSIIGYGSNVSSLSKNPGCGSAPATLYVSGTGAGAIQSATFQGFAVSANHLDSAACGFYGMQNSTLLDVSCGNAKPGADHEIEFGSVQYGNIGEDYGLTVYNLKALDDVGVGKGAEVTPLWNGALLSGGTVVSGGSKAYTQQYTRVQLIGPDLATCSVVPTAAVSVSGIESAKFNNLSATTYGAVTGITVANPGKCASTDQLYFLIQDGVPVTYGMKFTNLNMSHVWNLETTASAMYAEGWLPNSGNNTIFGEHPYTNQTIQILENGQGNKHTSAFFDSPGQFGAEIGGRAGQFTDAIFSWDGSTYLGSSGYLLTGPVGGYGSWTIQNSQCTDNSNGFVSVVTGQGALPSTSSPPSGVTLNDIEACDGSLAVHWPTQVSSN